MGATKLSSVPETCTASEALAPSVEEAVIVSAPEREPVTWTRA